MAFTMPTLGTDSSGNVTFTTAGNWLASSAAAVANGATEFLNALAAQNAIDFAQVGDLPAFNSVVWLGSAPGILDRPTRPDLTVDIQALLDRLNTLTVPTAPTTSFSYFDPGYSSQLQQPMFDKLLNDLVYGGYGIDSADEISLFNRARDREAMLTAASVADAARLAAGTSFPMPQGALYATLQKARQDEANKMSSVNRDIALKRADLYVENRRRVIEQTLQSEQLTIGLYNAIQNRSLQAAQVEVQMAIILFDSAVKVFQANIEALKTQIEANLEAVRATVQTYAADVASYAAFVNALIAASQIDVANSRNVLLRDTAVHQSRVDIVKFQLQELMTTQEFRKSINQFALDFFRTGFGSAINGVNGLAVQSGTV